MLKTLQIFNKMLKNEVLSAAHNAVKNGKAFLLYLEEPTTSCICDGFRFIFKQFNTSLKLPAKTGKDPLLPPYDDMLFVRKMPSNDLIINKFMQTYGHVLFTATDPNALQTDELKHDDFFCISEILSSFDSGIAYYNCGIESGCSQKHKHFQYSPYDDNPILEEMRKETKLPFKYYVEKIKDLEPKTLELSYRNLISKIKKDQSYNFIVKKGCSVLVPRKASRSNNIMLNSVAVSGILGLLDATDTDMQMEAMEMLKEVCIENE